MASQLSKKAALPLAKILATCRNNVSNTGPRISAAMVLTYFSWDFLASTTDWLKQFATNPLLRAANLSGCHHLNSYIPKKITNAVVTVCKTHIISTKIRHMWRYYVVCGDGRRWKTNFVRFIPTLSNGSFFHVTGPLYRSPVNSPHKWPVTWTLMFLLCGST